MDNVVIYWSKDNGDTWFPMRLEPGTYLAGLYEAGAMDGDTVIQIDGITYTATAPFDPINVPVVFSGPGDVSITQTEAD